MGGRAWWAGKARAEGTEHRSGTQVRVSPAWAGHNAQTRAGSSTRCPRPWPPWSRPRCCHHTATTLPPPYCAVPSCPLLGAPATPSIVPPGVGIAAPASCTGSCHSIHHAGPCTQLRLPPWTAQPASPSQSPPSSHQAPPRALPRCSPACAAAPARHSRSWKQPGSCPCPVEAPAAVRWHSRHQRLLAEMEGRRFLQDNRFPRRGRNTASALGAPRVSLGTPHLIPPPQPAPLLHKPPARPSLGAPGSLGGEGLQRCFPAYKAARPSRGACGPPQRPPAARWP